jgi:hypothetical protein
MHTREAASEPGVVELRRYVTQPNGCDAFYDLFERRLIEPLEAAGMRVLGQFRDLHNPDLCVWLRGFTDMVARKRSLEAFYGSALWASYRDAINATLIDSDDVFLLRPAWDGSGLPSPIGARAGIGAQSIPRGVVVATVHFLNAPADDAVRRNCRPQASACLRDAGSCAIGWYVTEPAANDFPRLPVRSGEHVLASLALFPDMASVQAFENRGVHANPLEPLLAAWVVAPAQSHHLLPTARSAIHA